MSTRADVHFVGNVITSSDTVLQYEHMTLILEPGFIAWLFFDLQGRQVNVVNNAVLEDAQKVLDALESFVGEGRVKLILLCSGKPETFIAGADIDEMYPNVDLSKAIEASKSGQRLFQRVASLKAITISCINGAALGAGLELALACDYRVCSDSPKTQLGVPEVKLGLLPGAGGTVRLPRLIGLQQALTLILSGGSIRPAKALSLHLVDAVLPCGPPKFREESFLLGAKKFALDILSQHGVHKRDVAPDGGIQEKFLEQWAIFRWIVSKKAAKSLDKLTRGRYPAPYLALESAVHSLGADFDAALDYEANLFGRLAVSPESKALMAVYYLMESAKKVPRSLKLKVPLPEIRKIGIVGAGVMGAQIATIAISKGFAVLVRDISEDAIQAGMRHVRLALDELVQKKRISIQRRDSMLKVLEFSTNVNNFRDCDLVIEAAVENLSLKQKIIQEIEKVLPTTAIFATNTSSLSITALASSSARPGQVCGMHFFNPVHKMPLVEIVKGDATEDWCIAVVYRLSLALGKTPCVCRDGPGFVVNRILGIYMNEAGFLSMEGNPIQAIDQALTDFGMPMGPFRLMDEVGLDVAAHVGPILERGLGARFKQEPKFVSVLVGNPKRLGKKTSAGFFLYDEKGRTDTNKLNPEMSKEIHAIRSGLKTRLSSSKTIADRCILLSLQEACYILSEQICDSPEVLDLAMIFGTGFAPFRGGLFNYADQYGIPAIVSRLKQLAAEHGERFDPHPLLLKMSANSSLFFPDRPHGMTPVSSIPRTSLRPSKL